jgi:hypothetical protein
MTMGDVQPESEVEVTGVPDETGDPVVEPTVPVPPLDPSGTPSTEPVTPADVLAPIDTPAIAPAVPDAPPPVATVVDVPPEPTAPPPPPPAGDAVAAIDAADDQARADQLKREAAASLALSTNTPTILPPPLAAVADIPVASTAAPVTGNTLWICVTEEGPRTTINSVTCPTFLVERIPPQGQLIACPTCGGTVVRQATKEEQTPAPVAQTA